LTGQRNEKKLTPICQNIAGLMDLNNIELPSSVIVELYHSSLIGENEIVAEKKITKEITPPISVLKNTATWKSLGDNRKNILIMVNNSDAVHIPDNELSFLTGVLGACKLNMGDVAIVNRNNHLEASYKELTSFFKSKIVFLFDIEPAAFGLPMNFPHYQIQAFAGNSFLFSPSLKELENDKVEKSKLWVSLKRLFNL
jgi:hypothetical protein